MPASKGRELLPLTLYVSVWSYHAEHEWESLNSNLAMLQNRQSRTVKHTVLHIVDSSVLHHEQLHNSVYLLYSIVKDAERKRRNAEKWKNTVPTQVENENVRVISRRNPFFIASTENNKPKSPELSVRGSVCVWADGSCRTGGCVELWEWI